MESITLSLERSDADTKWEINLVQEKLVQVEGGGGRYNTSIATKTSISYRYQDEVLVSTNFKGSGSTMTNSGYVRALKW